MGSDPELRDSSSAALGALQKCVGEQALAMILSKSIVNDERKMAKIGEYYQKIKVFFQIFKKSFFNVTFPKKGNSTNLFIFVFNK